MGKSGTIIIRRIFLKILEIFVRFNGKNNWDQSSAEKLPQEVSALPQKVRLVDSRSFSIWNFTQKIKENDKKH